MVVGVYRLDLRIHEVNSLKLKRRILRKIIDRTKNKFNVAIAEVGDNDLWQRAKVGLVVVGNDSRHVNSMMETITTFIEELNIAEIIDTEGELLHYEQGRGKRGAR